MKWQILSRNERSVTVNGRHFYAIRCTLRDIWRIEELDAPEGQKTIRVVGYVAETRKLSLRLKEYI